MRSHRELAELAARQHGVVSFRQLREMGISKGKISRSTEAFRLRRVRRGVYAVGHDHLDIGGGARRRRGIRAHRAVALDPEWGYIDDIPVTDLLRTLADVAATQPIRELTAAVDTAIRREFLNLTAIDTFLARRMRTPGSRRLGEAIEIYREPVFDRARSELLFLDLVKKAGLPRPALNTWVEKFEIDAYWDAERFAVEVDGWEVHGTRRAFEEDRARIDDMKLAGIDVVQITARRIERQPREVGRRVRLHLDRRRRELRP